MAEECVAGFDDVELTTFFEGTLGMGGHAKLILEKHPEIETYYGCDRDPQAIEIAKRRLAPWSEKLKPINKDFARAIEELKSEKRKKIDGFFLTSECRLCS